MENCIYEIPAHHGKLSLCQHGIRSGHAGGGCGLLLLFLIGADRFMLPALMLVSGLLLILQKKIEPEEGTNHE